MSFGSFLSKAAKLAGKAIVAVASEVINKGPLQINKQYLDKVASFNLDARQRSVLKLAKKNNEKALDMKREQSEISGNIKDLKSEVENLKSNEKTLLLDLVRLAKKLPINYDAQDKKGIELILSIKTDDIGVENEEVVNEFNKNRDLYLNEVNINSEPISTLEERIGDYDLLLKEKKSDYQDFFPELIEAMQNVKSFGDEMLRENNERMGKK